MIWIILGLWICEVLLGLLEQFLTAISSAVCDARTRMQ
jgi:hypothetical protein